MWDETNGCVCSHACMHLIGEHQYCVMWTPSLPTAQNVLNADHTCGHGFGSAVHSYALRCAQCTLTHIMVRYCLIFISLLSHIERPSDQDGAGVGVTLKCQVEEVIGDAQSFQKWSPQMEVTVLHTSCMGPALFTWHLHAFQTHVHCTDLYHTCACMSSSHFVGGDWTHIPIFFWSITLFFIYMQMESDLEARYHNWMGNTCALQLWSAISLQRFLWLKKELCFRKQRLYAVFVLSMKFYF